MTEALQQLLPWKGLAVGLWLVFFLVMERLRPAASEPTTTGPAAGFLAHWGRWRRLTRNLLLWCPVVVLSVFVVLPLTQWASEQALTWRPDWWQGGLGLGLDLLILDGLIYAWHRANHVVQLLWRFHEVHHRDAFLDASSALRFHWGEVLLSALARALVILALGFPLVSILVFETLVLLAAVFHHSNIKLAPALERAISWVFVTPSIHWVHHHAVRRDTDSNYATILSVWDRLFGSRSATARRLDMEIGTEGRPEGDVWPLLWAPFKS